MKKIITLLSLALCTTSVFAQSEKIRLYEGKAPGCENWAQQEYLFEYTTSVSPGEVGECIVNVVDPELWAYLPAKGTETGAAVVVCPGGGFTALSWHQEGPNVARWLAAHGIAAFVLKYRIAYSGDYEEAKYVVDHSYGNQGRDARMRELTDKHARIAEEQGYDRKMAWDDGRTAIAYIRTNADKYGVNPKAIGIIGFSAGGNIVYHVALDHDENSRPDFLGMIYPAWFEDRVPDDPMPLFIAASTGEAASTNFLGDTPALYNAWNKTRQPLEIHSFTGTFHGFGYRENGQSVNVWTTLFYNFLDNCGMLSACGSTDKTVSDLPVRKACTLERLYQDMPQEIRQDTPDIAFVNALCAGKVDDVVSLFREKKLFWDEAPAVDTPYDRFEGLDGIRAFADGFLAKFHAQAATFTPVFQTIGGGRIALEGVFKFVVDGEIEEVPFFVITDLRTPKLLEEVRMYTHYSFIPDLTPYRKPIFKPAHYEMGDPGLLTGAMRAYYEALHHAPYCNPDKIHAAFADDCIIGGYEPWGATILPKEEMAKNAHRFGYGLATYIPACVGMRYETIIDDGKTCVIEWCHIVSKQGQQERNRIAMSGCSAYMRNDEGYLCSVRISDYAGHEGEIDWTKTKVSKEEAYSINLVDEFPAGCGMKEQETY